MDQGAQVRRRRIRKTRGPALHLLGPMAIGDRSAPGRLAAERQALSAGARRERPPQRTRTTAPPAAGRVAAHRARPAQRARPLARAWRLSRNAFAQRRPAVAGAHGAARGGATARRWASRRRRSHAVFHRRGAGPLARGAGVDRRLGQQPRGQARRRRRKRPPDLDGGGRCNEWPHHDHRAARTEGQHARPGQGQAGDAGHADQAQGPADARRRDAARGLARGLRQPPLPRPGAGRYGAGAPSARGLGERSAALHRSGRSPARARSDDARRSHRVSPRRSAACAAGSARPAGHLRRRRRRRRRRRHTISTSSLRRAPKAPESVHAARCSSPMAATARAWCARRPRSCASPSW